jgi:hypothetical protein
MRLLALLLCTACWLLPISARGSAQTSDEEALVSLHQEIMALIGEPRCENIVHCRLLALGSRPCGGPAEYLAYSSIVGRRDVLEAKAYEYGFLQEEVNRARKVSGNCTVLEKPRLACTNGRCTLDTERR